MQLRELFGLATAIMVLAGVATAIIYGDKTAKVLQATAEGFGSVIKAATLQGGGTR